MICSSCGLENPEGARFCNQCAAPLAAHSDPAREVRKTVTGSFLVVPQASAQAGALERCPHGRLGVAQFMRRVQSAPPAGSRRGPHGESGYCEGRRHPSARAEEGEGMSDASR
ncbi:MAG: zinc-ribbon domain-containing protein, partial [Gaiellales bacterium]